MDIRTLLLKDNSKANVEAIATWVGTSVERMQELVNIFLNDEYRVVQIAAHAIGKIGDVHPEMILIHVDTFLKRLQDADVPVAVKRNVVRVLQYIDIPESLHGAAMNICFDYLADPNEAIAVRVFSMTVLDNLSKIYPEIRQELVAIIQDTLEQGCTAAFKARAKTILSR